MTEEIVTITTVDSLTEAEACRLGLESEGITVFLADAELIRTDWLLMNAVGSIKVQVPQSQAERAMALIDEIRERHAATEEEEDDCCLACGSVMQEEATECPACGWSYANAEEAVEE